MEPADKDAVASATWLYVAQNPVLPHIINYRRNKIMRKDFVMNENTVPAEAENSEESYYGDLIVQVFTASGAFPVSDALVTITSQESGLVSVLVTGEDGRTPAIRLSAPSPSESFNPSDKTPFSLYNIDTDAAGFYGVRNIGAAIYPGITSIQRVELIPIVRDSVKYNGNEELIYNDNRNVDTLQ